MATQIQGDGDPGDLHPVETADEVERFIEWVESERMRHTLDDYTRAQAEEMAADCEAEEASAGWWNGKEAHNGWRGRVAPCRWPRPRKRGG